MTAGALVSQERHDFDAANCFKYVANTNFGEINVIQM